MPYKGRGVFSISIGLTILIIAMCDFLLSYHGASVYSHILKDWEFFVEEYDGLLLSQSVIFLLSYHGASVFSVMGMG